MKFLQIRRQSDRKKVFSKIFRVRLWSEVNPMTNEAMIEAYRSDPSNTKLLDALLYANRKLILKLAHKIINAYHMNQESVLADLVQEGNIALWDIITGDRYDPAKAALTTYAYPFIWKGMKKWVERSYPQYESISDLIEAEFSEDENTINYAGSLEYQVMCRIWIEQLRKLFDQLTPREQYILGYFLGVFDYPKMSPEDLALEMEMTIDGIYKAKDAAIRHLRKLYPGSTLQVWRNAYFLTKNVAKG